MTKLQILQTEMHSLRVDYYQAQAKSDLNGMEKIILRSTILNRRISELLDAEKGD